MMDSGTHFLTVSGWERGYGRKPRFRPGRIPLDLLAEHLERHLDMEKLLYLADVARMLIERITAALEGDKR